MSDLTCPKCHGAMRAYERNNITVDQCTECRGIFLDRGELERLIDAEAAWAAQQAAAPPQAPPPSRQTPPSYQQPQYQDHDYSYDQRRQGPYKRKRKSFLEELFD